MLKTDLSYEERKEYINRRLIPGSNWRDYAPILGHRLKGHWAVYADRGLYDPKTQTHEVVFVLVKIKEAHVTHVTVEHYGRLPLVRVYILPDRLPVDDHWPQYPGSSFMDGPMPIHKEEATEVLYLALADEVHGAPYWEELQALRFAIKADP